MHGSHASNSEADLVAVTFPPAIFGVVEKCGVKRRQQILAKSIEDNFANTEVCIIQCKTNWNDNAQVPMLWDLIYSSRGFTKTASVGRHGRSVTDLQRFAYAFATVPSNTNAKYSAKSLCVLRVKDLSGGTFWGRPSDADVALNLSEILDKNFQTAKSYCTGGWHSQQASTYENLAVTYPYFRLGSD
jgi:hypothetical protein